MKLTPILQSGTTNDSVAHTLEAFMGLFAGMGADRPGDLASVYHRNIRFTDPFTTVSGLAALENYFANAYANVIDCRFTFSDTLRDGNQLCLGWTMHLRHRRIRGGRQIDVEGISLLTVQQGKVVRHRDYFDIGELLYEHLPLVGRIIRWIRGHAG